MLKKVIMFAVPFIVFSACKKQQEDLVPAKPPTEIDNCSCEEIAPEYVKASFNNYPICFSTNRAANDTFANAYYYNAALHLDHISIVRINRTKTMTCYLNFVNCKLRDKTLPYTISNSGANNEYAELEVSNIDAAWHINTYDDYKGNTFKLLTVTVTDMANGFVKGYFSGEADSKTGKRVIIKSGIFNVHLIDVNH